MSEGVVDIRQMPKRELTEIQKRQASLLWFSEVDAGDLSLAGGKGANLGEMTRRGAPVPPGFVVSVVSYQKFLTDNGLDARLSEILGGVDVYHSSNLVEVAAQAQQAILSAPMPTDLAAEITEAYSELGEGPVAVRSSATAEDLPDASFAAAHVSERGGNRTGPGNRQGLLGESLRGAGHLLPCGAEFQSAWRRHRSTRAAHGAV